VRAISSSDGKRERYQVGDDIGLTWGKYLNEKGNFRKYQASGYLNFGLSDPFLGNTSNELLDLLYYEYIRIYWRFPNGN
jgi:hypothetical protein